MDWLEFKPWSREVERACRTWLDEASRHPHPPACPPPADPRELMREYGRTCETLLDLSRGDEPSPQRLA